VYHLVETIPSWVPETILELEKGENIPARILAIDFGMKRMGLAVSDALGITAQGLPTLACKRREDDLRRIQRLVEEYSAELVIVGNPISQAGGETAMSRRAAEFAEQLRRRLDRPVELWDERLTSVEANRTLRESGLSLEKRRQAVDRVAATLLLQSYLDFLENQRGRKAGAEP
jgi:putative Holliday junction resolvase